MSTTVDSVNGPLDPDAHYLGPMQAIHFPMNRHGEGEEVDYVIVGVGSAGGVLLQRLSRAGFSGDRIRCRTFLGYGAGLGE